MHLLHPLDDVHRHPDRPRLVGDRAGDRLADPPRRVRRELQATLPLELLHRADEPEHALLDQVEERQALVAVVLGDRDDEAQVALDHALLRLHVAALDPLGQLDLVRGGQERMPADLAQEELQGVGGRLQRLRSRERGSGLLVAPVDDLDAPLLQLLVQLLDLDRVEIEQLECLLELGSLDQARGVGALEQRLELLVVVGGRALVRHSRLSRAGMCRTAGAACRHACPDYPTRRSGQVNAGFTMTDVRRPGRNCRFLMRGRRARPLPRGVRAAGPAFQGQPASATITSSWKSRS